MEDVPETVHRTHADHDRVCCVVPWPLLRAQISPLVMSPGHRISLYLMDGGSPEVVLSDPQLARLHHHHGALAGAPHDI